MLSFGFVYVFTRTLTPSEYGTYTLVSNVVMFIQAVLFWSLSSAMVRFYPEAEKTSRIDTLLKTGYSMFAVGLALLLVVSYYSCRLLLRCKTEESRDESAPGPPSARLGGALVCCTGAAFFPARKATRVHPVEIIRGAS